MRPPAKPENLVFVGQGPNQEAWGRALLSGGKLAELRGDKSAESRAEQLCARLAITGAIGKKLAELGGFPFSLRFDGYGRANLNARWNGKAGKGDVFDAEEGKRRASELLGEPYTHYVLLGKEVAKAFGKSWDFLEARFDSDLEKEFLVFPHPSGISAWWNDPFNVFRARKRLREFLGRES